MENATDQEQIDAIRKWWQENGKAIIAGIVIGLAGVIGWQQWGAWKIRQAEDASALYQQVTAALQSGSADTAGSLADDLLANHASSPYASLAQFALAAGDVDGGQLEQARERYQWVIGNATQPEHADIARIRFARVLLAEDQHEAALGAIEQLGQAFAAEAEELRGDVYVAQGDPERARTAYQAAAATLAVEGGSNPWLTMKLDSLAAPAEAQ